MADDEIKRAVKECIAARKAAAAPLVFNAKALKIANQRTLAQFTANLQAVGGWKVARPALLKASTLFGAVAKAIARFHNPKAKVIGVDEMASARVLMEQECKFKVAKSKKKHPSAVTTSDGLVCN
jgi:hypothetical protein